MTKELENANTSHAQELQTARSEGQQECSQLQQQVQQLTEAQVNCNPHASRAKMLCVTVRPALRGQQQY